MESLFFVLELGATHPLAFSLGSMSVTFVLDVLLKMLGAPWWLQPLGAAAAFSVHLRRFGAWLGTKMGDAYVVVATVVTRALRLFTPALGESLGQLLDIALTGFAVVRDFGWNLGHVVYEYRFVRLVISPWSLVVINSATLTLLSYATCRFGLLPGLWPRVFAGTQHWPAWLSPWLFWWLATALVLSVGYGLRDWWPFAAWNWFLEQLFGPGPPAPPHRDAPAPVPPAQPVRLRRRRVEPEADEGPEVPVEVYA